jgi:hypothetical protein
MARAFAESVKAVCQVSSPAVGLADTVQGPETRAITLEVFIEYMLEFAFD